MSVFVFLENDMVFIKFIDFVYLEELVIDNDGGYYDGMLIFFICW